MSNLAETISVISETSERVIQAELMAKDYRALVESIEAAEKDPILWKLLKTLIFILEGDNKRMTTLLKRLKST